MPTEGSCRQIPLRRYLSVWGAYYQLVIDPIAVHMSTDGADLWHQAVTIVAVLIEMIEFSIIFVFRLSNLVRNRYIRLTVQNPGLRIYNSLSSNKGKSDECCDIISVLYESRIRQGISTHSYRAVLLIDELIHHIQGQYHCRQGRLLDSLCAPENYFSVGCTVCRPWTMTIRSKKILFWRCFAVHGNSCPDFAILAACAMKDIENRSTRRWRHVPIF